MVKLETGARAPDEVLFHDAEREAVVEAAVAAGYDHVSTFIRELCVEAALVSHMRGKSTDRQLLLGASKACDMRLGQWMREVTLAAIGYSGEVVDTPLPRHKREAAKWYRRKAGS